jgi:hypothetical protein
MTLNCDFEFEFGRGELRGEESEVRRLKIFEISKFLNHEYLELEYLVS